MVECVDIRGSSRPEVWAEWSSRLTLGELPGNIFVASKVVTRVDTSFVRGGMSGEGGVCD